MDVNIYHRTQFHTNGNDKRGLGNNVFGAKINPEISNAIRRQREISGVDYFKAATSTQAPTQSEKRGTINKIQNVSFDGYLPQFSATSQLKTNKNQLRRTKNGGKFGSLNRSKSSACLSLPTGRHLTRGQSSPHNVVVTDLTCLQLADTLFSCNLSTSLDFTSQSTGKFKYTNFTGEKRNLFNGENKTDLYTSFKNGTSSSIPLPSLNSPGRHRPESGNTSKRNELNISSQSRKENHRPNSSNTVKKMFQSSILSEKEELSPKSILKQNSIEPQQDLECKRSRYRTLSEKMPKKNTCQETPRCITLKASKIGIQSRNSTLKPCVLNFDDKDKRSVRFNISHEIFEYVPHEPVTI
jgi:hypothetical protein